MANNVAEKAIKEGIKAYLRLSRRLAAPGRSIGAAFSRLVEEAKQEMGAGPTETRALPPAGGTTASAGTGRARGAGATAATGRAVDQATPPREAGHESTGGPERVEDARTHVSSPQVDHEAVGGGAGRARSARTDAGGTTRRRSSGQRPGPGGRAPSRSKATTGRNTAATATGQSRQGSDTGATGSGSGGGPAGNGGAGHTFGPGNSAASETASAGNTVNEPTGGGSTGGQAVGGSAAGSDRGTADVSGGTPDTAAAGSGSQERRESGPVDPNPGT